MPPSFFTNLAKLRRDQDAAHLVGMPMEHARVFMEVARQEKCVISSRQLGRVCTGLMRAGYDTKGFRMKSKSCDFGPMAGFICLDERLHKKGAAYNPKQKADIEHSLHGDAWDQTKKWKASTEQICITEERLQELRNWNDAEVREARIDPAQMNPDVWVGDVARPVELHYALHKERRHGDEVWALYHAPRALPRTPVVWRAAWEVTVGGYGISPVMALVNPYPAYPVGHYKNCCTGDYDLFGVWPLKRLRGSDTLPVGHQLATTNKPVPYQPMSEDRRIAGMSSSTVMVGPPGNQMKAVDKQIADWEDKRLGNISNRVHMVGQMLNSLVQATVNRGRGRARDIVHHSDEAGRPFITGIDDHIIAFIPASGASYIVGVESPGGRPNIEQWVAFFRLVDDLGYQLILNTHWKAQMNAWGIGNLGTIGDSRGWRTPHNDPVRST